MDAIEPDKTDKTDLIDLDDYVSGSYFITKLAVRPAWHTNVGRSALPELLLSASPCLAEIIPASWTFDWLPPRDEALRQQAAAKFGISPSAVGPLCERVTTLEKQGQIAFDRVIFDLTTAQALVQEFMPSSPDLLILGLGLHRGLVADLLHELQGSQAYGPVAAISQGQPLAGATGEKPLGFDVIGLDFYGAVHSWLCGLSADEVFQALGLKVGKQGLFESYAAAYRVGDYIKTTGKGEPGVWLPWLVVQYSIS